MISEYVLEFDCYYLRVYSAGVSRAYTSYDKDSIKILQWHWDIISVEELQTQIALGIFEPIPSGLSLNAIRKVLV